MSRDEWRVGQAAFNDLSSLFPEIAERIRSTEADPFFDNAKMESFYIKVAELLTQNTQVSDA